jgi:hypothetical protein
MNVNRLKTHRESLVVLIKAAYLLVGFPLLLLCGTVMLFSVTSDRTNHRMQGDVAGTVFIWAAILIPVGMFMYSIVSRRSLLRKVVGTLRSPEYFAPEETNELYHVGDGKYLGIDIRNGTMLYVHKIRSGQMDVIGLTMADWTSKEVQGNVFKLYTKHPELPMIKIRTPWAMRWYDTLDAMTTKRYHTPQPFPQYVATHLTALQSRHRVYIPTFS